MALANSDGPARPATPPWVSMELAQLDRGGLKRRRRIVDHRRPGRISIAGRELIDFASNDYLGLAAEPSIAGAVADYLRSEGWGAAASPLITGYQAEHAQLEAELAAFTGAEAVVVFGSGYAANVAVLAATMDNRDVVFCEKRSHASLVDGCRLSGAKLQVFRSDQLDALERRLSGAAGYRRRVIVTDSVFSMDGEIAPLKELVDFAERFDASIYVDEAHAMGVLGPNGRGLAEVLQLEDRLPLRLGTLGKAFGCVGAFVITTSDLAEWLVNRCRPYIYSTALPTACAVAARAALSQIRRWPDLRARLRRLSDEMRTSLRAIDMPVKDAGTPIIPVILGEPHRALLAAQRLRSFGFCVPAIRPPTVPHQTARLRISISAAHDSTDVASLGAHLRSAIA